jgi:hypothetical protein
MGAGRKYLVALVAGALLSLGASTSSASQPSPELSCGIAAVHELRALDTNLSPEEGANVQQGSTVSFAASSQIPFSIAVASSPRALKTPDVDSGAATPQSEDGYVFASTKTAAHARTVYWQAFFSDASVPECAGFKPRLFLTDVHRLTVLAPGSAVPGSQSSALSIAFLSTKALAKTHPGVFYRVSCSIGCSGTVHYTVDVLRKGRLHDEPALDPYPTAISVPEPSGGTVPIALPFKGRALQTVRRLLGENKTIEVHLSLALAGATGTTVVKSQTTVRLAGGHGRPTRNT